jgi:hypothetical protein
MSKRHSRIYLNYLKGKNNIQNADKTTMYCKEYLTPSTVALPPLLCDLIRFLRGVSSLLIVCFDLLNV